MIAERSDSSIPQRYFREEVAYRSVSMHGRPALLECGFTARIDAPRDWRRGALTDDFVLLYVIRGQGRHADAQGRMTPIDAGNVVRIWPGESGITSPDRHANWAMCWVRMDGPIVEHLARLGSISRRSILRPGVHLDLLGQFDQVLHGMRQRPDTLMPWTLLQAHQLLLDVEHRDTGGRHGDPVDMAIARACVRLGEDPHLETVRLDECAAAANLPPDRFRQLFRERVGMDPAEFRLQRRMDYARALLAEGRLTNRDVSARLGYPTVAAFTLQYRRVFGRNPDASTRT